MELQLVQNLKKDKNGFIIFNNGLRIKLNDIPHVNTLTVDALTEHRIHLLSEAAFNTVDYADLLVIYNNIVNPFYIPINTELKIPDLTYIQSKLLLFEQANSTAIIEKKESGLTNSITGKSIESTNTILSNGRIIFAKQ
jgi:hypothetical protein